ncbi:MAG: hypothetical protein LRY55_01035 [Leadbetterella sp.]|nr:hypothetical protein [Leadbetterella sp.]
MTANFWYILAGMGTSFLFCAAILLFYMKYRKNIMQQQYQLKVAEMEYQKKLLHSVVEAQEEERKRIAVALHDDMGNRLNILSLLLNNAGTPGRDAPDVSGYVSEMIGTVRNISHSLYPVNLEKLGLILYIEELVSLLSNKIIVSLHLANDYKRKSVFKEVQLYRIIQEFTTNVVKHSDAGEITIWIKDNPQDMYVILSDNGHSFDYATGRKGMGLKNIEARINSMNALFKWKNVLRQGSRLIIKIPTDHESDYSNSHY